jgi:magnesium-transporting ATPase (P-type)
MLPALALVAEVPIAGLMRQPPRSRGERLLHLLVVIRAYFFLGLLEATAAMAAFFYVLHEAGWQYGVSLAKNDPVYLQATTACLAAIVLAQVCNVFLCRHPQQSALRFGLLANPLLIGGIAFELLLICLIVYTPWGNALFGTLPLPLNAWLSMVPFVAGMFVLEEGRKWLIRRRQPKAADRETA